VAVSVILPTYNERETICAVIGGVQTALDHAGHDHEIIVVDDGSPDGTASLVRTAYADDDAVQVLVREHAAGLSSAVLDGLAAASGDVAVVMDADGQHPPERVPDLVAVLADESGPRGGCRHPGADLVVGSRHASGGAIEGWPWHRRAISHVAASIARQAVPAAGRISDPMSGFFALDRTVVDDAVLQACDPHGYKILLEIATHAPDGIRIGEVPITFRERQGGQSKLTADEMLRFAEHVVSLGATDRGLGEWVHVPLAIRAVQTGVLVGGALLLLFVGLIVGGVDGAAGAGLIAGSGSLLALALLRAARAGETWTETDERVAKGGRR
jgi:dolichol-phosphate mannosyltransferase